MKASSLFVSLSILLASGTALPSPAWAGNPEHSRAASSAVSKLVEKALLKPLVAREEARSTYSRARMPPAARQVRVLDSAPVADPQGREFVRFAVDEKRFTAWERGTLVGCAYVADGAVFVRHGTKVQSAAQYVGQAGPKVTTECTAATTLSSRR